MNNMNNMKLGNRVGSPRGVEERNHRFYRTLTVHLENGEKKEFSNASFYLEGSWVKLFHNDGNVTVYPSENVAKLEAVGRSE